MNIEQQKKIGEIVKDVHSKMIDSELMDKYHLSVLELKAVLNYLVASKMLARDELYRRPIESDESIESMSRRQLLRQRLAFLLPIYEIDSPEIQGWVTDITEKGIGTTRIRAVAGETKTFVIAPRKLKSVDQVTFTAECRWNSTEGRDEVPIAGFRIIKISLDGLMQLRNLIKLITFGEEK